MIIKNKKEIITIYNNGKLITTVIYFGKIVYQLFKSCFSSGFWINDKPWINIEPWKNNK